MRNLLRALCRSIAKSWMLSRCYYRLHGIRLVALPTEHVWYFAYGANMHDSAFRESHGMRPLEWRARRVRGYRLRFNLEGWPKGRAAPAKLCPDAEGEVWGVLYRITRHDLVHLDATRRRTRSAVLATLARRRRHRQTAAPGITSGPPNRWI